MQTLSLATKIDVCRTGFQDRLNGKRKRRDFGSGCLMKLETSLNVTDAITACVFLSVAVLQTSHFC